MSDIEDLIEGLIHVAILGTTYKLGQDGRRLLAEAAKRNDPLGMLFSAIVCGGSMYAFQSSARNLNRLIWKHRSTLPIFDLRENKSLGTPARYLPR